MGQRSDARQKMVQAAKQLMRERGYNATAFSDVLKLSGAPRGSVYFHFPGGKTELAIEAAAAHAHEQVEMIDRAAEAADSATRLIEIYVDLGREGMVASDYTRGCGVAPLVNEGATQESKEVAEASRQSFAEMIDRLTHHFVAFGLDRPTARTLADAVIAGIEGAMVTARAQRSPAPYDAVQAALTHYAASVSPRSSGRKSSGRNSADRNSSGRKGSGQS